MAESATGPVEIDLPARRYGGGPRADHTYSLQVELEILRPPAPGRYQAQLDIVHELITWFDPSGQHFPRLPIEVL